MVFPEAFTCIIGESDNKHQKHRHPEVWEIKNAINPAPKRQNDAMPSLSNPTIDLRITEQRH